jgi:hypothetical protein
MFGVPHRAGFDRARQLVTVVYILHHVKLQILASKEIKAVTAEEWDSIKVDLLLSIRSS